MKLFGIGTDIIKTSRLKKSITNKFFLRRLFHEKEISRCKNLKNKLNCFAKRYAAKEAFAKALGTGIAKGLSFNEIIIQNEKNGKPFIKLIDGTKKNVEKRIRSKNYSISLSLTDEDNYAVAFVTISKWVKKNYLL